MADGVDKEKTEQERRHYHAAALYRLYGVYLYKIAMVSKEDFLVQNQPGALAPGCNLCKLFVIFRRRPATIKSN